jgi:polysaccharide deacetylase family protein (PEP-CTERM system associated)
MRNVITVDVEEWYHSNGLNIPKERWGDYPSTVVNNTMNLLDLFDEHQVKATFFILGVIARNHPLLVKEIVSRGHEIGSHGLNHRLVSKLSMKEFEIDLKESLARIEDITQKKITYYRAPSWSISKEKLEVLTILEDNGIICDSSLQPFQTPLSGIDGLPSEPYVPILNGRALKLIEFPPTVCHLFNNVKFSYAGGFYLRFFPYWFIQKMLKKLNKIREGMVYIHPWEIDSNIPKIRTMAHLKFVQYYNLRTTLEKLEKLLKDFAFMSLGEVIKGKIYPEKCLDHV